MNGCGRFCDGRHARIAEELDILMEGIITAQVRFQRELTLPLKGRYRSHVTVNADVPVRFDVTDDGIIPVDTVADIRLRTDVSYMGARTLRNLDIRAKLPMQFSLPVRLTAPVDDRMAFRYDGPLVMNLHQTITTTLDTVINTRLDVSERVSAPVIAEIPMRTIAPARPLRTTITRLPISGLVRDIGLSVTDDPEQPQRSDPLWGPAGVPMAERPVAAGRNLPGEAVDRRSSAPPLERQPTGSPGHDWGFSARPDQPAPSSCARRARSRAARRSCSRSI